MTTPAQMNNVWPEILYKHEDNPAAFRRSRDQWGEFSNMTGQFPITVNGIRFQSSEGLYQALKFPDDPTKQATIAQANSGYSAKQAQRSWQPYPGWDDDRVNAMRVALAFKLAQNPRFAAILLNTDDRDIVENSSRDTFWGAQPVPEGFRGANVLGHLLMELRDTVRNTGHHQPALAALQFSEAAFRHRPIVAGKPLAATMLSDHPSSVPLVETPF